MTNLAANPCRCIGRPLRFVAGECFTCGRFLPGEIGRPDRAARAHNERPGIAALLEAVDRKRREIYARGPRPRPANARRVVIDLSTPAPKGARSRAVRDVEFLTRTF